MGQICGSSPALGAEPSTGEPQYSADAPMNQSSDSINNSQKITKEASKKTLNAIEKVENVSKKYKFGRTLGSGGSSRVVKAYLKKDKNNEIAIKIMDKVFLNAENLFNHEITMINTLGKHPSILPIIGHGSDKGCFYILSKLLSGGRLFDRILSSYEIKALNIANNVNNANDNEDTKTQVPSQSSAIANDDVNSYELTEKDACNYVKQMLRCVKYCHDNGIIHRDLKPENFLFSNKDFKNSNLVLIDFGCAREIDGISNELKEDEKTNNVIPKSINDIVGTAYYMAPELAVNALKDYQNIGYNYDKFLTLNEDNNILYDLKDLKLSSNVLKSSDLWSIGIISYIMMLGRVPFDGRNNIEIFENIINNKLSFPSDNSDNDDYIDSLNIHPHFKDFLIKILNKNPKKRINIDEALNHPWVNGIDIENYKLNKNVLKILKQFNKQSKLKEEITNVLSLNMHEKMNESITNHFKRLDSNNDGLLNFDEIKYLLLDVGYSHYECKTLSKQIIETADKDNDNMISFDEFKSLWYRKILTINDIYIRKVFNVFDDNGDGFVDTNELKSVLFSSATAEDDDNNNQLSKLKSLIAEVDNDEDGKISFDEFENAMKEDMNNNSFDIKKLNKGGFIGDKPGGLN